MDYFLTGIGFLLGLAGIFGSLIPVVPGPSLSYAGLLVIHFTGTYQFSTRFLIFWAAIVLILYVLDFIIPAVGAKKFGGSRSGSWGSLIGMILGMILFPPIGLLIGCFVGALVGELMAGKKTNEAVVAGFGAFLGFLMGTLLKLVAAGMMTWYMIEEVFY